MNTKIEVSQILTLEEIISLYPDEWVLIVSPKLDEYLNVIHGEVLVHSPDRDEVYSQLSLRKGRPVAIEYTGIIPEDLAVML